MDLLRKVFKPFPGVGFCQSLSFRNVVPTRVDSRTHVQIRIVEVPIVTCKCP